MGRHHHYLCHRPPSCWGATATACFQGPLTKTCRRLPGGRDWPGLPIPLPCLGPSNHYCNEWIWQLHCTVNPTLLFEEVIPPIMQKNRLLTINGRLRGFVPHLSIQTSLSCIWICIWILLISYKYKRHSRVIWWGPLPLAMCRLLRLVSSTNHDHRSSHPCKRLFKHSARHDVDSCFSYPC